MDWRCFAGEQSALLEGEPQCNGGCAFFPGLKVSLLGCCDNIRAYQVQFGLFVVSLSQERERCQEAFSLTGTGPVEAVNCRGLAGALLTDNRRCCPAAKFSVAPGL